MIDAGVFDAGHCVRRWKKYFVLAKVGRRFDGRKNREHGIHLIFPKESEIAASLLRILRDRRFMSMPAYLGGRFHLAGEKFYGSNGRNVRKGLPRSILMATLNDVETGQLLAYMSQPIWLSAMRTGAVPGVVAKHLSVSESADTFGTALK